MKWLLFCFFYSISLLTNGQSKTDANTIFICIPKEDYAALFSNSFIKDTLFVCKENTTKTNKDEYTGKYYIGEFATLEFFQPNENKKFGENLQDFGIEFKSRKIGYVDSIKNQKKNTKLLLEKTYLDSGNTSDLWYSALKITENKSNSEISIIEYSTDYLKMLGFTEEQLLLSISPAEFNKIVYGPSKYPRKFQSIATISIEVNTQGWHYLKKVAATLGYTLHQDYLQCDGFQIYYTKNKKLPKTLLKEITVQLNQNFPNRIIPISANLSISISKDTAKLLFQS